MILLCVYFFAVVLIVATIIITINSVTIMNETDYIIYMAHLELRKTYKSMMEEK